jgi:hypothetical protein
MLNPGTKVKLLDGTGLTISRVRCDAVVISSKFGCFAVTMKDFDKFFEKVQTWTEWTKCENGMEYKTDNDKYTVVRVGGKKATAKCHPNDAFDLQTGIIVALSKIIKKQLE